jgi:hypothetical protein
MMLAIGCCSAIWVDAQEFVPHTVIAYRSLAHAKRPRVCHTLHSTLASDLASEGRVVHSHAA